MALTAAIHFRSYKSTSLARRHQRELTTKPPATTVREPSLVASDSKCPSPEEADLPWTSARASLGVIRVLETRPGCPPRDVMRLLGRSRELHVTLIRALVGTVEKRPARSPPLPRSICPVEAPLYPRLATRNIPIG